MAVAHIPALYRIFFLYIDPLFSTAGIYGFLFDHKLFIESGVPVALKKLPTTTLTPFSEHMITTLGAYTLFILAMQILLVHGFKDEPNGLNVRIWRIAMFGMLLVDFIILWTMYSASPDVFFHVSKWEAGDYTNNVITGLVTVMRIAFLLGVGGVERKH